MVIYSKDQIRDALEHIVLEKEANGFDVAGMQAEVMTLPDSYDALIGYFDKLDRVPLRRDWKYVEPVEWADIAAEMKPVEKKTLPAETVEEKTRTAFLTSVAGCILGKPLEMNPTYARMKAAFEPMGEWPLKDYVSADMVRVCGRDDMGYCLRDQIQYAGQDDDINYSVIGMLVLERSGRGFTQDDLAWVWQNHMLPCYAFGPEVQFLLQTASSTRSGGPVFDGTWAKYRRGMGLCGALIRADAYGYANPGDPAAAAEMAWRDASMTHRYTGVYGEMMAAAAIAAAYTAQSPEEIVEAMLACVPQKSRLAECGYDCLDMVRKAKDFESAYFAINKKYETFTHCQIYQETGTLINTLFHAKDAGDGICRQVMQGNDTDSYGCTSGSILGAYFGKLDARWITPFKDRIVMGIGNAPETSLSALAQRMANLYKIK